MPSRRELLGATLGAGLAGAARASVSECVFCRLVAGDEPSVTVWRDAHAIAFGALHPRVPGHVLVAPLAHVENLYGVDRALAGHLFGAAADVARAMKRALRADGVTLIQNNEAAGDQTVFHLHVHVIPRFVGRPMLPARDSAEATLEERERALAPLRDALR